MTSSKSAEWSRSTPGRSPWPRNVFSVKPAGLSTPVLGAENAARSTFSTRPPSVVWPSIARRLASRKRPSLMVRVVLMHQDVSRLHQDVNSRFTTLVRPQNLLKNLIQTVREAPVAERSSLRGTARTLPSHNKSGSGRDGGLAVRNSFTGSLRRGGDCEGLLVRVPPSGGSRARASALATRHECREELPAKAGALTRPHACSPPRD